MNLSLAELLAGMRRALDDDVRPDVSSDHARVQLAAVVDALGKLERLTSWSPDLLREQWQALQSGCAAIALRARQAGLVLPASCSNRMITEVEADSIAGAKSPLSRNVSQALSQADLERSVSDSEQQLKALCDWLFEPGHRLPMELHRELDAMLQVTLRDALLAERKRVSRADFTSMTSTGARP
jgi:hypothetical protein